MRAAWKKQEPAGVNSQLNPLLNTIMLYEFDHHLVEDFRKSLTDEPDDEQLMSRIKQSDDAALAILYRRHAQFLRTIAGAVVNNHHDVDEVIQEVFLTIWRRAGHYDEKKGKALGWIVTLARRRAIDQVRKAQSYGRARDRFQVESQNELNVSRGVNRGVERDVIASEMAEVLDRAMDTLPVAQREAIHFAFYRGLSQREIAAHTGIPLGTIKTRIELALRKLRDAILALCGPVEWLLVTA
jgi:RNA polymerase sigma-70 factor (ECF subfamily)